MTYNVFGGTSKLLNQPTPTPLLPRFIEPRLSFVMAQDRLLVMVPVWL